MFALLRIIFITSYIRTLKRKIMRHARYVVAKLNEFGIWQFDRYVAVAGTIKIPNQFFQYIAFLNFN